MIYTNIFTFKSIESSTCAKWRQIMNVVIRRLIIINKCVTRSTQTYSFTRISTVKINVNIKYTNKKDILHFKELYLFKPTAGIETLESDAERLKDSSSPSGALPSGMDVLLLSLLKNNI